MTDQKIRVGDKVHATSILDEDSATFRVTALGEDGIIESAFGSFIPENFDFKVLERAIPTTPGLYFFAPGLIYLALSNKGTWHEVDFTNPVTFSKEADAGQVKSMFDRRPYTLVHEFDSFNPLVDIR